MSSKTAFSKKKKKKEKRKKKKVQWTVMWTYWDHECFQKNGKTSVNINLYKHCTKKQKKNKKKITEVVENKLFR